MRSLYVCAETGNDVWSGKLSEPNGTQTDGPLRTLAAAQSTVRRIRSELTAPESIEVTLRGGVYRLAQTLVFEAPDSGFGRTENKNARIWPVVWRAADGEQVTISGGRPVGGWRPDTLNGKTVWRADAPWLEPGPNAIRQLWIDGVRRPRARLPKQGTFCVARALDANYDGPHHATIRRGSRRFVFGEGDIDPTWLN
jgi:hypothetical protein